MSDVVTSSTLITGGAASQICVAPRCTRLAVPHKLLCASCLRAPASRRGGWLSAYRKKEAKTLAGVVLFTPTGQAVPPSSEQLDASLVLGRGRAGPGSIWVGSRPPTDRPLVGFDVLVLCARSIQPTRAALPAGYVEYLLHCPLQDAVPTRLEVGRALAASKRTSEHVQAGRNVLVTCAAGINRSALVAALAILRLTTMRVDAVIELLKTRRHPDCLFNGSFCEILRRFASSPARR